MSASNLDTAEGVIVDAIHRSLGPLPVLLWGSRANGAAEQGSDYDVFVVVPTRALPRAAGRLPALSEALEARLGVGVSLSPLPRAMLQLQGRRLPFWKLSRESRVLAGADELSSAPASPPGLTSRGRFSYAMSAVFYLLEELDRSRLGEAALPPETRRRTRKALLHVTQLRLMHKGEYATHLEQALGELGDPLLRALADRIEHSDAWFAVREQLLTELTVCRRRTNPLRTLIVNAQYTALALLSRSPHWRTGLSVKAVDTRFADAAVHLLLAVRPGGLLDEAHLKAARRSLPRSLRRRGKLSWEEARDLLCREWPNAHPLVGL